jgi:hypothetical protein
MALEIGLLFHLNQHISEHARLASYACYRGLLRCLRDRPHIKANIHISGTLVHALTWLDPEPLEMIKGGLEAGQFELLGSTYAQNIPYASDDRDNTRQIELHKRLMQDTFGVEPQTFWNPERCWRQSLLPLIAGAGYRTVLIEDAILEASGARGAQVYQTRAGNQALKVIRDDEALKHRFNFAAWFGQPGGLHAYLDGILKSGGRYLAYAEDAEAMGLWGYAQGIIPYQTWERLGQVLDGLLDYLNLTFSHFREAPQPIAERTPIREGCARWMDASLARPDRPYHEAGYADWFDFNARSPKLARYRKKHAEFRRQLITPEASSSPGERKLRQAALHTFLAHQYEFGCIGIGDRNYRGWDGMQAALALSWIADRAAASSPGIAQADINKDGYPEASLSDGRNLLVTSPVGGRLLYWIDLQEGKQLIGNPLAVVPGEYKGDAFPPPTLSRPNLWIPKEGGHLEADLIQEPPPTRLGKYLPDWIWEGETGPFELAVRSMILPGERTLLTAQRRGMLDEISLDGGELLAPDETLEFGIQKETVIYRRTLGSGVSLEKTYRISDGGLTTTYSFANAGSSSHYISLAVTSEICLDYEAVLRYGQRALEFSPHEFSPGVVNPLTGETLVYQADPAWGRIVRRPALLALEVGLAFDFTLAPGEKKVLDVALIRDFSIAV